jgi:hypothetical protein
MGRRGTLRSALRTPWCRALAIAGVYVLTLQSMQLPLLAAETPASCCCAHRSGDEKCACPMCAHRRETQSGKPFLKTCGAAAVAVAIVAPQIALPAVVSASIDRPAPAPVRARVTSPPPDPALEVPTPPPLALA